MHREQERAAALLERRTAILAARGREAADEVQRRAVIVWQVGGARAALDVGHVAAVIPFTGCAAVPTRVAACLGVIGWSGRIYSVIDMRQGAGGAAPLLAGAAPLPEHTGHLLLLRGAAPHLALAVDAVLGRFDLPDTGTTLDHDGHIVSLLDPAALRARLGSPTEPQHT